MGEKIVVIGDLHIREDEPFFSVSKRFLQWLKESEYNSPEVTFIFTGDITHKPIMTGKTARALVETFFEGLRVRKTYILQGNHDYDRKKGSSLEVFRSGPFPNVVIIDTPTEIQIVDTGFWLFPYFYPNSNSGFETMKSAYEEFYTDGRDHIIGHFGDETVPIMSDVDISHLTGVRTLGHIHNPVNENYVGTPYVTRKDEAGKASRIAVIDADTSRREWVVVPKLMDYVDVEFGEYPTIPEGQEIIVSVKNAPSQDAVKEAYGDYYIGTVVVKSLMTRVENVDSGIQGAMRPILDYFDGFASENSLSEGVQKKIRRVIA